MISGVWRIVVSIRGHYVSNKFNNVLVVVPSKSCLRYPWPLCERNSLSAVLVLHCWRFARDHLAFMLSGCYWPLCCVVCGYFWFDHAKSLNKRSWNSDAFLCLSCSTSAWGRKLPRNLRIPGNSSCCGNEGQTEKTTVTAESGSIPRSESSKHNHLVGFHTMFPMGMRNMGQCHRQTSTVVDGIWSLGHSVNVSLNHKCHDHQWLDPLNQLICGIYAD